jgi:hypothetical protein
VIYSRDKFTIHSRAVVCQDVELKGDITIGPGTVVHPKATIFAIAGPIIIGSGCIIEEAAIIVNRRKEVMRVGDNNLFEIGCRMSFPPSVPSVANFLHRCRMSICWQFQHYIDACARPPYCANNKLLCHWCCMPRGSYRRRDPRRLHVHLRTRCRKKDLEWKGTDSRG